MMKEQDRKESLPNAEVLLVEHSMRHAERVVRAFREISPRSTVHVVSTSEEALYYLFRAGAYARRSAVWPRLVLLNVAVPGIGSIEVIDRLKRDRVGCAIPVVAVALAADGDYARQFCSRGASSFVAAPDDPEQYITLMRHVASYWLGINVAPRLVSSTTRFE